MNRKTFLIPIIALLMLLSMAAPIMAVPPTRGTFTQGIVHVELSPGTAFIRGDVLHVRGSTAESYLYGAPWGNTLAGMSITTHMKANLVTWTGSVILQTVDSYDAGTVKGSVKIKMIGVGPYTYMGPTFSFEVGEVSETVTNGETYFGVLFTGFAVKHGISGGLKGLETKETFTGVMVFAGPLEGVNIVENTVTYKLPG